MQTVEYAAGNVPVGQAVGQHQVLAIPQCQAQVRRSHRLAERFGMGIRQGNMDPREGLIASRRLYDQQGGPPLAPPQRLQLSLGIVVGVIPGVFAVSTLIVRIPRTRFALRAQQ